MDYAEEQLKFAKEIEIGKVEREDRVYIRQILLQIIQFQEPMPKLNIIVKPAGNHYNIIIKGWDQPIDDKIWYKKFLDKETREDCCDYIITSQTIPTDDEGNAVKIVKVSRLSQPPTSQKRSK